MSRTPADSSDRPADLSAEDALIVREALRQLAEMGTGTAPPFPEALQRRIDAEMGVDEPQAPEGRRKSTAPERP